MGNWGINGSGFASEKHFMFTGELPWHRVGTELPHVATWAETIEACPILGSKVEKLQATWDGKEIPDTFVIVRSWIEDGKEVKIPIATVGKDYQPFQPEQLGTLLDSICKDAHGARIETAGTLFGGKRDFVTCALPGWLSLKTKSGKEVDQVRVKLMLSNSHDGGSHLFGGSSYVRTVCMNTEAMFRNSALTKAYVRHSGNMATKCNDLGDALGLVYKEAEQVHELYTALIQKEPTAEQVETVLQTLFADTGNSKRMENQRNRVLVNMNQGYGNDRDGIRGTAWALYNGITQLEDHEANAGSKLANADSIRLNTALFGSGMVRKELALSTIQQVCLS